MRKSSIVGLTLLGLSLSGCEEGGVGSGSSVASIPAPPTSPAPSSPQSPPPPRTTSESPTGAFGVNAAVSDPVAAIQTFSALGTSAGSSGGTPASGTMTEVTMALSPSSVSIGRDADGGYTITVPVETKTESPGINPAVRTLLFAANTRFSTPALPKLAYYAARQDASSTGEKGGDRYLTLSNPDGFAHMTFAEISLCNTSSGKGCGVPLGSPVPGKIMLVFGQATPLADVPLGGSASYHGLFDLAAMDGDRLSGNLMISLDFGQRTATGSLTHVERYWNACDAQGCVMPYSDIGLTGSLATDGTLGGTVTPSSEITSGTWSGRFFGPGSAELGGSMLMQGKSAGWSGFTIFGGVFGAKKQ